MPEKRFQIATICGCIEHTLAFTLWCEDFVSVLEEEVVYVAEAVEVISDATRLQSFLALRKLDDFLGAVTAKPDDLTSDKLSLNKSTILGSPKRTFLDEGDRSRINKGVAHLTESLTLDYDSQVDLLRIIKDSVPIFERLLLELRRADTNDEATSWLNATDKLIQRVKTLYTD